MPPFASGNVSFYAALDTGEEGLYVSSRGSIRLVARTGTVIPGLGTIANLENPNGIFGPWDAQAFRAAVAPSMITTRSPSTAH